MFEDQAFNLPQFVSRDATISSQTDRFQPELALAAWRTDMDVGWLVGFIRVEVESEGSDP
jgi:hypothetical protein